MNLKRIKFKAVNEKNFIFDKKKKFFAQIHFTNYFFPSNLSVFSLVLSILRMQTIIKKKS